jgi:hypothetical protein
MTPKEDPMKDQLRYGNTKVINVLDGRGQAVWPSLLCTKLLMSVFHVPFTDRLCLAEKSPQGPSMSLHLEGLNIGLTMVHITETTRFS